VGTGDQSSLNVALRILLERTPSSHWDPTMLNPKNQQLNRVSSACRSIGPQLGRQAFPLQRALQWIINDG